MQFKTITGVVLSAALLCFTPVTQATAAAVEPYGIVSPLYEIAREAWADLRISDSSADCTSKAISEDAVKIVAVQTLEKQGFLWTWSTYDNTTWTKEANTNVISMSNTKTGLTSGKYRLKTDFTLTNEQGKSETVTVYSDEKKVS